MASITLKDLNQRIDVSQYISEARQKWEKNQKNRLSLENRLVGFLPLALVVMVMVFYSLSAPHTAHILDMVTPGWGMFAPIGFEIGLLIISALMEAGWRGWIMHVVLWLLLSMSVVINIAASFLVVVAASPIIGGDISVFTFQDLLGMYGSLPASIQIVLLMVVPVGFTIPVITKLAGEAVVKLALGKVTLNKTSIDEMWAKVEQHEVKGALMQAAIKLGAGVKTAGSWATAIVEEMYREIDIEPTRAVGTRRENGNSHSDEKQKVYAFHQMTSHRAEISNNSQLPIPNGNGMGNEALRPKMALAVQWLQDNPSDVHLSGRELEEQRSPDGVRLSYRTWNDAKKYVR